jgi:hypothetical protein
MDTPTAEAERQEKGQGRNIVDLGFGYMEQSSHDQGNQTHVQECGGEAAHREKVGADFAGLAQNQPETVKHMESVRHAEGCDQESHTHESEHQLQKAAFGHVLNLFHNLPPKNKNGQSSSTKLNCPDGRHKTPTLHRSDLRNPSVM